MKVALFTLRLRMETAGGVAGTEVVTAEGSTLKLRLAPDGTVHLPGTTVAGSLRAHCGPGLADLFGAESKASPIQVLGTVYHEAGEPVPHTRTAIDRERGAARTNTYHVVEQLLAGTEFDIMLRWNNPESARREAFLRKLKSWHPRLGRGVSHGSGKCKLVGWGVADYDLNTPDGLLDWIQHTGLDSYPKPTLPAEAEPSSEVFNIEMAIVDGLHCGVDEAEKPEKEPRRVYRLYEDGPRAIPGSTLKGVLRSRAEYICRVVGTDACTEQDCGRCQPCRIFGFVGTRAAVAVPTAVIEDAEFQDRPHVAIDRFTGGYKHGALYTDEVVVAGRFRLRVDRIGKLEERDVALLQAVVTDLHDGLIGIGENTMGGYGTVRVLDPDWRRPVLTDLADLLRKEAA
ncbi:RAMP superfamily CRISPR-associated protein [Saccharopolyspora sp. K220]|uniref:RAMP superfamily CRISPR-associated protein n=1 Tax=Saccharopolyspora soli TaxID=2926618 RepID=UPI001F56D7B8|nr:RAMP superfamily CRISPR-associated protein [Saccharopolyspora soli]MCI2416187.1 RAMP superfamily CRISPR-associated protein [Saccharopolyspora soli]